MPRKRFQDPAINKDKYFGKLSDKARLLFRGLIDIADDEGFIQGDPLFLRSEIFPYDDLSCDEVKKLRDEVEKSKQESPMIILYSVQNQTEVEEYIQLPKWWNYQPLPDYPIPSKIVNLLLDNRVLISKGTVNTHRSLARKYSFNKQRNALRNRKGTGKEQEGNE